ncbi:hypothetical protein [Vibrio phage P23]|nr:hypothetical protein [Vibrio phage P23]
MSEFVYVVFAHVYLSLINHLPTIPPHKNQHCDKPHKYSKMASSYLNL